MRPNNERRGNLPVPHWMFQSKLTELFLCLKAAPGLALFVVLLLGPMALKATRVSATELFVALHLAEAQGQIFWLPLRAYQLFYLENTTKHHKT